MGQPSKVRKLDRQREGMDHVENPRVSFKPISEKEAVCMEGLLLLERLASNGHWIPAWNVKDYIKTFNGYEKAQAAFIAKSLNLKQALELLENAGANIYGKDKSGNTLMHHGLYSKDNDRVKALLKISQLFQHIPNAMDYLPIHLAAEMGNLFCLNLFLNHGSNANAITSYGETLLHICAYKNSAECLDTLLKKTTQNINRKNNSGLTALHVAVFHNRAECIKLLLKAGADTNRTNNTGDTVLHTCTRTGNSECLKLLLEYCRHLREWKNKDYYTPLMEAAAANSKECMKLLISAGSNVNAAGPNGEGSLHISAFWGNAGCLKVLIKNGANVNMDSQDFMPPLHYAAQKGYDKCVRLLLLSGANVNAKDINGWSALHRSAAGGFTECASLLIQAGAALNARNSSQQTPMHIAADGVDGAKVAMLRMLAQAGAVVNVQDDSGQTPLHLAVIRKNKSALSALLAAGADDSKKNYSGKTPSQLAKVMMSKKCLQYLLQRK